MPDEADSDMKHQLGEFFEFWRNSFMYFQSHRRASLHSDAIERQYVVYVE